MNIEYAPEDLERVDEIIQRNDVRFIRLQFSDIIGVSKQVTIPADYWQRAVDVGIWFDGSSIEGFARVAESDMYLKPDLDTFCAVPWELDLSTAQVTCDVFTPDFEPFAGDPRYILKKQLRRAAELGLDYKVGPELEFFLFRPHADGSLLPLQAHDQAGYFDVSTDLALGIRRQVVDALGVQGVRVTSAHHEVAQSQSEIDLDYDSALIAADNIITTRLTIKAIAQKNGLHCTFMPKPITGINGSGMHVHQSLWDIHSGKTAMHDEQNEYGLSQTALHFIAGQLEHAKGMTALLAPLVNSYKRLVPGYEAPVYLSWGRTNRSALIRIPRVIVDRHQSTRCELRCPDPSANPYLAFSVMLAAGLDGIENKLPLSPPAEEDLFQVDGVRAGLDILPNDLGTALDELSQDKVIQDAIGQHIYERFIEAKRLEWDEYRGYVSDWEHKRYLALY